MANLLLRALERSDECDSAIDASDTRNVVVASFGDPLAADCAAALGAHAVVDLSQSESSLKLLANAQGADAILFLPTMLDAAKSAAVDAFVDWAIEREVAFIGIVSSFRVHFGDERVATMESHVLGRLRSSRARVIIFRPGHVLGAHSTLSTLLRRLSFLAPLAPSRLCSSCLHESELFAAIHAARRNSRHRRTCTLLGPNRSWKDRLREHHVGGVLSTCLLIVGFLLSLLLVGHLAALMFDLLTRWRPALRQWNFDALRPRTLAELLTLYNPYSFQHVKVVGYNNGVHHFGHSYPGKTIISTVHCNHVARAGPNEIKADCGTTIHRVRTFLSDEEQDLLVIPNYSYVCLGTAFFVPIHGSASDYTTMAETITRVMLYDPVRDCFVYAERDETAFRDHVYRTDLPLLLVRLWLRVKAKARYFVQREEKDGASCDELLTDLRDGIAANVEIRKAKASAQTVQVSKYYHASQAQAPGLIEVPRDSLGRLWDRLEEHALTSFLMHYLTRRFAWHVELFFTAEEFRTFWRTHAGLPLRKMQIRYIRRDGLPHSPFRDHDCVSVDMFMFRWHRQAFEAYLKQTFAVVRSNPGKHSQ